MSLPLLTPSIEELSALFVKSKRAKNPALYLHQHGARALLFKLEGLMRIYRFVSSKKKYNTFYKEFKALEDTLGAIDYALSMQSEFAKHNAVKKVSNLLFTGMLNEECGFLNDLIANHEISDKHYFDHLIEKVRSDEKLEMDTVVHGTALLMARDMTKILKGLEKGKYDLDDIETGLHELRRKIRWISIYAQVLDGRLQLEKVAKVPAPYQAYCTKAITSSPFNKMAKAPKGGLTLHVQAHHFYALSYLIATLGELKDIGQRCMVFDELMNAAQIKDTKAQENYFALQAEHPDKISDTAMDLLDQMLASEQLFYYLIKDLMR